MVPGSRRLVVAASAGVAGAGPLSVVGDTLLRLPPVFAVAADPAESTGPSPAGVAIEVLRRRWIRASGVDGMLEAIDAANRELRRSTPLCGPASVLVALLAGGAVTVARAGDCAAYVLREGRLRRITNTRKVAALGSLDAQPFEMRTVPSRDKDVFLLCSRQPADWISEAQLTAVLESSPDPKVAVPLLAQRAAGEGISVTIVIFRLGTMLSLPRAAVA